jgi:hypothetical protein
MLLSAKLQVVTEGFRQRVGLRRGLSSVSQQQDKATITTLRRTWASRLAPMASGHLLSPAIGPSVGGTLIDTALNLHTEFLHDLGWAKSNFSKVRLDAIRWSIGG